MPRLKSLTRHRRTPRSWRTELLRRKRSWLVACLLVSTTPSLARADETPDAAATGSTPILATFSPIRLVAGEMKANPFVQSPAPVFVPSPIVQASDRTISEIRLKTIGTAVGLLPIGSPVSVATPLVTEEPAPSTVQVNPHTVMGTTETLVESLLPVVEATELETVEPKTMELGSMELSGPSDPIEFNLNDLGAPALIAPKTAESLSAPVGETTWDELPEPIQDWSGELGDEPANEPKIESAVAEAATPSPIRMLATQSETDHISHLPAASRPPLRYRPAVAVAAPPMMATGAMRKGSPEDARVLQSATVTPALPIAFRLEGETTVVRDSRPATEPTEAANRFQCRVTKVASLTLPGAVQDIEVEDPSVCRVVGIAARHLRVVGCQPGTTRLTVRCLDAETNAVRTETFLWETIDATADEKGSQRTEDALMRLIGSEFPSARIDLQSASGRLIVRGTCDSDDDARAIVRMIRKARLIAVEDQLIIR